MPGRWPIHPLPCPGESLSSWLERIAKAYGYNTEDLLVYDLGFKAMSARELDLNPPEPLLMRLYERTGVPIGQIRTMTVQGWGALLIDGLDPNPFRFPTYAGEHSLLYPAALRPLPELADWVPWLQMSSTDNEQVCSICLGGKPEPYRRLSWRMAWMLTCPTHGVMLDDVPLSLENVDSKLEKPIAAPPELIALDLLTKQAVEKGVVSLPRREVHGGVWLRLLRALIDELSLPASSLRQYRSNIVRIWNRIGLEVRQGVRSSNAPFEKMKFEQQVLLMKAAGIAVQMMQNKEFKQKGEGAILFESLPIDQQDLPSFPTLKNRSEEASEYERSWNKVAGLIDKLSAEMQKSPGDAALFHAFLLGPDPSSTKVESINSLFQELGFFSPDPAA